MDEGQRLNESVEFKFAKNFSDMREMSTMVALTAGQSAIEIGINKHGCHADYSKSIQKQQFLRKPLRRTKLFNDYERGKIST